MCANPAAPRGAKLTQESRGSASGRKRSAIRSASPTAATARSAAAGASEKRCRLQRTRSSMEGVQPELERNCACLLKHRRRMARDEALFIGRDDPDGDGRVVGAYESLAAVFVTRGIENRARPPRAFDNL